MPESTTEQEYERTIHALIEDRDKWQSAAMANKAVAEEGDKALAYVMGAVEDLQKSHAHLAALLESCLRHDIPESLRWDIQAALSTNLAPIPEPGHE